MAEGRTARNADVALGRSYFPDAAALGIVPLAAPYAYEKTRSALVANDADPNIAPLSEADASVVFAKEKGLASIMVQAFWGGATQVVTCAAWAFEASATANKWRCVSRWQFDPAAPLAQTISTGGRSIFVQVVSGADAGHPVDLQFDAA